MDNSIYCAKYTCMVDDGYVKIGLKPYRFAICRT
jgi:hypothetical protein